MKLCESCRYRNNTEYEKPCIVYRDDCEFYEKERGDMADDLISRDAVIYYIKGHIHEIITESGEDKNAHTNRVLRALINGVETMPPVNPQEPCGEIVSLEAFKQVMRERDIAIEQLKELGYGFGQKIEPQESEEV